MAVEYTKAMLEDLNSFESMTFDQAKAFADKYDISVRSVISKCRALEVEYKPKVKTATGAKAVKVTKADLVKEIEALTEVSFKNLSNLVMEDLETLLDLVKEA